MLTAHSNGHSAATGSDYVPTSVVHSHDLELYTTQEVVRGSVSSAHARLSDLVNHLADATLTMIHTSLDAIHNGGEPGDYTEDPLRIRLSTVEVVAAAPALEDSYTSDGGANGNGARSNGHSNGVDIPDVRAGVTLDSPTDLARRLSGSNGTTSDNGSSPETGDITRKAPEYVPKRPRRCRFHTHNYVVEGDCHLHRHMTTLDELLELPNAFVPLTDVTIRHQGDNSKGEHRAFALVNKSFLFAHRILKPIIKA